MTYAIRKLAPSDAQAWWDLRLEALKLEPRAFGKSVAEHLATPVSDLESRYNNPPAGTIHAGAFDAATGTLIGKATFIRDRSDKGGHKGNIYGVYVTPARRGQGVAKALMNWILDRARQDPPGLESVILAVSSDNTAAKRLYESLGFRTFGVEPAAIRIGPGDYVDEDYMVLRVAGSSSGSSSTGGATTVAGC